MYLSKCLQLRDKVITKIIIYKKLTQEYVKCRILG